MVIVESIFADPKPVANAPLEKIAFADVRDVVFWQGRPIFLWDVDGPITWKERLLKSEEAVMVWFFLRPLGVLRIDDLEYPLDTPLLIPLIGRTTFIPVAFALPTYVLGF